MKIAMQFWSLVVLSYVNDYFVKSLLESDGCFILNQTSASVKYFLNECYCKKLNEPYKCLPRIIEKNWNLLLRLRFQSNSSEKGQTEYKITFLIISKSALNWQYFQKFCKSLESFYFSSNSAHYFLLCAPINEMLNCAVLVAICKPYYNNLRENRNKLQ